MNTKRILIALAVLLIAGAAVWGFKKHLKAKEKSDFLVGLSFKKGGESLEDTFVTPKEIVEIKITNPTGSVTFEKNEFEQWFETDPYYYETNPDYVLAMPIKLATMNEKNLVVKDAPDLAKYGLDKPDVVVKFRTTDNRWRELRFGARTPTEASYYTYNPDTRNVFLTEFTFKQDFSGEATEYLNRKLFRNDPKTADRVIVETDGKTLEFEFHRDTGYWFMTKPVPGKVQQSGFVGQLVNLRNLEAVGINKPEALPYDTAFDKPRAKITAIKTGEWSESILVSSARPGNVAVLKRTDTKFVVFLSEDHIDRILNNFQNAKSILALWFPKRSVKRYELIRDGKSFVITREDQKSEWKLEGNPEARIDSGALLTSIFKLQDLKNEGYIDAVMPGADPKYGLENPAITVKMEFFHPKVKQVTIYYGAKDPSGKFVYSYNSEDPNILMVDASVLNTVPKSVESVMLR